jgi:hypothetical protein
VDRWTFIDHAREHRVRRVAGYSATPLPRKLGIKEGHRVAFPGAPDDFPASLGELPPAVDIRARATRPLDLIVAFFTRRPDLERRFAGLAEAVYPDGSLWVAWPKRASGVETDLTEDVLRQIALPAGLVDNKVCAIDQTWSGLRLVHRLENRGR